MKKFTILLGLLAVLLAACGSPDLSSDLPGDVLNTNWEWQQLITTDPASQSMVANSADYALVFNQDGQYLIMADCNVVQGEYKVSGESLSFKIGTPNLVECGAGSSYCQYLFWLVQVDGYKLEEGSLVLTFGGGAGQMIFADVGRAEFVPPTGGNGGENGGAGGDGGLGGDGGAGGDGNKKVTVCHKAGSKNPVTIEISQSALQAHLNHGDVQGPCR